MELKIIGSELELAGFLKALGSVTTKLQPIDIVQEIEHSLEKKDKEYMTTSEVAKHFKLCSQTIINYKNAGMPHITNGKAFMYCLEDIEPWIKKHQKIHKARGRKKASKPKAKTPFGQWKSELSKMCHDVGKDEGKMLSLTFKYMTKNYGIVWEQSKRDFFNANKYLPTSTCQIAYWLESTKPAYKNLTKSCLATVIKEECNV